MIIKLIIYLYFLPPTPKDVLEECKKVGIKHPEIVVKQSILETGWYKHYKYNNLFGLYNSRTHDYYRFDSWRESVQGYKDLVQYRYESGDYYEWLTKIGYAEDPRYIWKLKNINVSLE